MLSTSLGSAAGTLNVSVVDEQGQPVSGVAVFARPSSGQIAAPAKTRPPAIMDQRDRQFVPHVLVVQTGTAVEFPNSDLVSHHVYSFSGAKSFELALYKGDVYPPVQFDEPGVVVLGCNIHDDMLGYIVVVDTPFFATTDEHGAAHWSDLPSGSYVLEAWTPRVRRSGLPPSIPFELGAGSRDLTLQLSGRVAADREIASSLTWARY